MGRGYGNRGVERASDVGPTKTGVAVVGGGAAGLYVSLRAAEQGAQVTLVSRKPLAESASYWAQGGLAAALAPDDSPARHADDTLNAGRGLCRAEAVQTLTREAPAAVEELRRRGVRFDTEADGSLGLGLEGGHSARRIVHAGGAQTGRAITGCLAERVAAEDRRPGAGGDLGARPVERRQPLRRGGHGRRADRRFAPRFWPPVAARRCGGAPPTPGARSGPAR